MCTATAAALFAKDHVGADGGADAGSDASVDAASNDSGDAASDASDAATIAIPAPKLLHGFDDGVVPPTSVTYADDLNSGFINGVIGPVLTAADGNACPGALLTTLQFPANAATADGGMVNEHLDIEFPVSADWSGYTKLHVNVKILVTGGNYLQLNGFQVFVRSQGFTNLINAGTFQYVPGTFGDGAWHEVTLALTSTAGATSGYNAYDPTHIFTYGVDLTERSPPATGGPTTAPVTTMLLDDIWLE